MPVEENTFHGRSGVEFKISGIGIPHRERFQKKIKEKLKEYCKHSSLSQINVLEIGCGVGYTTLKILGADKRIKVVFKG